MARGTQFHWIVGLLSLHTCGGCADLRTALVSPHPHGAQGPMAAKGGPPKAAPALSIAEPPRGQTVAAQTVPSVPQSPPSVPELSPGIPENPVAKLRELHRKAAERHATMDTYIMRLRRREVVGGSQRAEEIMLGKFRREPWSVYFKWLGSEAKGREVVYVKDRYENLIHTLTAAGDIPLMPGGKRIRVPVDSALAKAKSRYPITEAGLGGVIDQFGQLLDALEKGDSNQGTAKYLGQIKRPEFETKVDAILHVIPPQANRHLPRGGQRFLYFNLDSHLPVLIITQDEAGREVEYYCHDRIQHPVALDDDDFNPDVLWRAKKN